MSEPRHSLALLSRAARVWADRQPVDAATDADAWLELERAVARGRRRRRAGAIAGGAGLAAAALVAVLAVLRGEPRVSFVARGAELSPEGRFEPRAVPARLSFSDGTEVVLQPGARGAVVGTSPRGARLRLDEGRARFAVAHRDHAEWAIDAGPFVVVVHGTVFDLDWSSAPAALVVDLMAGKVTVKGPLPGGTVTLEPGQRLTVQPARGEMRVDRAPAAAAAIGARVAPVVAEIPAPAAAAGAPAAPADPEGAGAAMPEADEVEGAAPGVAIETPVPAPAPAARAVVAPASRSRRTVRRLAVHAADLVEPASPERTHRDPDAAEGSPRGIAAAAAAARTAPPALESPPSPLAAASVGWGGRVAIGQFHTVVAEAEALGIARCLTDLPAESLLALADAARYTRRSELARRALLAQRRRFPRTVAAHDAAFLIGRLAEDAAHDRREALSWYDRYLEEGDRGSYVSEALGRKMLALDSLGDGEAAGAAAERYLTEFPEGAYAAQARKLRAAAADR